MQTEHMKVTGMTCGGCAEKVTGALKAIAGVVDVKISIGTGETAVQFDDRLVTSSQLKSAVTEAGYGVNVAPAVKSQRKGCCGCCG
jgi:copper chaperone